MAAVATVVAVTAFFTSLSVQSVALLKGPLRIAMCRPSCSATCRVSNAPKAVVIIFRLAFRLEPLPKPRSAATDDRDGGPFPRVQREGKIIEQQP